ncbi:hypothetical protein P7C73_g2902, partial [Tremellales sp. Uapishka_1]
MPCQDAPTSTLFGTLTSYIESVYTSTSEFTVTPMPTFSTVSTATCATGGLSSPWDVLDASLASGSSVQLLPLQVGGEDLAVGTSGQTPGMTMAATRTTSTVRPHATSGGLTRTLTSPQRDKAKNPSRESSTAPDVSRGSHARHHRRRQGSNHERAFDECPFGSWTTLTSIHTIQGRPTPTSTIVVLTTSIPALVTSPTETLYSTCESSYTITAATSLSVSSISTSSFPWNATQDFALSQTTSMSTWSTASISYQSHRKPKPTADVTWVSTSASTLTTTTSSYTTPSPSPAFTHSASLLSDQIPATPSSTLPTPTSPPPLDTAGTPSRSSILPSASSSVSSANDSSSSSGKSAGIAIEGVLALLFLIAFTLFLVRLWTRRTRQRRTNELRSSWFYGGDVAEPEQREEPTPQSRFSAPSLAPSRINRISRAVPAFLALPISHMRASSSRFPSTSKFRHQGQNPASHYNWADKYRMAVTPPISSPRPLPPVKEPDWNPVLTVTAPTESAVS